MDKTVLSQHMKILDRYYPSMDITQLGLVVLMLGIIRATMGHEGSKGTVTNYIHPKYLSDNVRQCLDYIEREVLSIKKSKIDIDYWKKGKTGKFRRDKDL